jgi:hypothetical protein
VGNIISWQAHRGFAEISAVDATLYASQKEKAAYAAFNLYSFINFL